MSEPVHELRPRHALQRRVTAAILERRGRVLAVRGEQASMSAVAEASGVARATVYRYFPNREALLAELADVAVSRADAGLAAARIDEVAPLEGVRRAVRALVEVGDPFVAVARNRARPDAGELRATPRRAAAPRCSSAGRRGGDIRADIPSAWLTESLVGARRQRAGRAARARARGHDRRDRRPLPARRRRRSR